MPTITVSHLVKTFAKTKAINDISFDIEKGEIFGFLGPNGAGKTTTIRCMMDFLHPTSGTIEIEGKSAQTHAIELKKTIGYLSGGAKLYDNWTSAEHISYFEKIRGNASAKNAQNLIDRFGLDTRIKTKNLSTGNKQKLAVVLAFMHNPSVLILDEPTNGLDPLLQQEFYDLLAEHQNRGATIFMSSHNLSEVEKICNRVGIIRQGKLVALESMSALRRKKIHLIHVEIAANSNPINVQDFQNLPDVEVDMQQTNAKMISLQVKGDLSPVIKRLASYQIQDIDIGHASLEQVFMEFYQKNSNGNGVKK